MLEELKALVARFPDEPGKAIAVHRLASAAGFSSRAVELFVDVKPERPLLAVVIDGRKDVVFRGERLVMGPGDVLIVPANVTYTATTAPDRRSRRYTVFCTEVDPQAAAAFSRAHPELSRTPALGAFELDRPHVLAASEPVLQAWAHFARTLLGSDSEAALVRHRLEDVLLSLSLQHAKGRTKVAADPVLGARLLMRAEPEAPWAAATVARRLAMSPATLRRKLAASGVTLKTLRAEERMALAAVLLAEPGARVGDVAVRCGYASASKFARQYRRWFGHPPAERAVRARS